MIAEIVVSVLVVVGGFFGLVGSYGLVKLPDPMTRLHAPTKSATLGVGAVLIASLIWFPARHGVLTWHELLITLFLFLTAPVTGYFIAKRICIWAGAATNCPARRPARTGRPSATRTRKAWSIAAPANRDRCVSCCGIRMPIAAAGWRCRTACPTATGT